MYDFRSCKIPLNILIELIGHIKPREFSISRAYDNKIELTIGEVYYKTLLGRDKIGVFTDYIKQINQINLYPSLRLAFREGSFPKVDSNDNLILICTGTGYAPIRNFIWKCIELQHRGTILLFYGCRNKDKDFLYSDEYEIFRKHLK